jgi:hypothetical protein
MAAQERIEHDIMAENPNLTDIVNKVKELGRPKSETFLGKAEPTS